MALTCESIVECAQRLARSARAAHADTIDVQRTELTDLVALHLREAERRLSTVGKRALLRDHRRCLQLVRAIGLSLDDEDLSGAAARAQELARFVVAHQERERPYLSSDGA